MKRLFLYFFACLFAGEASGQYYLRGQVTNDKNQPVQNVKIFLHSAKANYTSGAQGGFGITVMRLYDTLTLTKEGYEPQTLPVKSDQWQSILMKLSADNASNKKPKLISITKNYEQAGKYKWFVSDETYFQLVENDLVNTGRFPLTGFSLNVNKASYSNIRRFLNMKSAVPPDAVRIEELVNYFNLSYHEPRPGETFNMGSQVTDCPWSKKDQLLFVNISARKLPLTQIPPGNFVFLIDVSGSMDMPNRLPLLQAAFQMLVKNLRAIDTVSIVTYGGTVGVWLQPTSGADKTKINKAIEELTASGDTPGESAIRTAYKLAQSTFIKGGNNRVIIATDGDFNVGETTEKALEELILKEKQSGIYLTCLGVGMGNFKDSKLQTLAKKGNGNYAYLDDIKEAEKILVQELTQTFYAVADNVFLNVEFNPSMIKQYRLIGFDNKKEALSDTTTNLEGGEIGSGSSILAVFQVQPTEQNSLSYGAAMTDELATLQLSYSLCNDTIQIQDRFKVMNDYCMIDSVDKEIKFAAALTLFGLQLKQSKYLGQGNWNMITALANGSADKSSYLQLEFLQLVEKAKKIYVRKGKKKKGAD